MNTRVEAEQGTSNLVQLEALDEDSPWSYVCRSVGGRGRLFALYAVLLALLCAVGHELALPGADKPIVWPAAGLVFGFLWLGDRRYWPQLLLIQVTVELATGLLLSGLPWMSLLASTLAHSGGALAGAAFARHQFGGSNVVRVATLAQFMLAAAVSAMVSAPFTAIASLLAGPGAVTAHWLLVTILADWLGVLLVVPPLLAWGLPRRTTFPLLSRPMILELILLALGQGLVVMYVFMMSPPFGAGLRLPPALVLPLLLYAAVRFPPRWGTLLILGTLLLACGLMTRGANPFAIDDPFGRTVWIQVTASAIVSLAIMLIAYLTSHRLMMAELADTEARYRSFVELSSEAVWRVELLQPLPLSLPPVQQRAWLREHARIVEHSDSYARIQGTGDPARWSDAVPWVPALESRLEATRNATITISELPFTVDAGGTRRAYLSSFQGVVSNHQLQRLWGVARDVTELLELNSQLRREQGRLKRYSQRMVTVEEQARRTTAMDLHDGIGQELVGLNLTLKALGDQLSPEQRLLVDGLRGRLDHMQARTRDMISDLSPPGLYDLGLEAALQWLVNELRSHNGLHVSLDYRADESRLWLELRVVVFKVARELLRNVVKHAGVNHASICIRGDDQMLVVSVQDDGLGFDWSPELYGTFRRGFGLLSVVERVAGEGGSIAVDTAPGRGAKFTMKFSLRGAQDSGGETNLADA